MWRMGFVSRPDVTQADLRRQYRRPPSLVGHLPWLEYLPAPQCFLLEDGRSVGALFELEQVACEARPDRFLKTLRDTLQNAITHSIPEEDNPWVLQCYLQDEPDLTAVHTAMRDYVQPAVQGSAYTTHYLAHLAQHLEDVCRPGGLFIDEAVTGAAWRGQRRRVRGTLYRRQDSRRPGTHAVSPEEELNDVLAKLFQTLRASGLRVQRGGGREFYEWLLPWFNPAPPMTGGNAVPLLALAPYPGDADLPYGADLAEQLFLGDLPVSEGRVWWFDGLPHRYVSVMGLRQVPGIGHVSAERKQGDHAYALFDRMPPGTVMAMTMVITPQDMVLHHLERIEHAAFGDSAEAELAKHEAHAAKREVAQGNKLYPMSLGFYLRGEPGQPINADDAVSDAAQQLHRARALRMLRQHTQLLHSLLVTNGFKAVAEDHDTLGLDSYLRNLPMNYRPHLDKTRRRSRLVFAAHLANLLPAYGRARGSGRPGLLFFNRGAEPLLFDPLSRYDRKQNAHMLILGPTGAGKTATLNYILSTVMALYRPRLYLVEGANSLGLLCDDFAAHGLRVHRAAFTPDADLSLPPFADAFKLLERPIDPGAGLDEEDDAAEDARRDYLGEMELAARLMITGGEAKEEAMLTRADRMLIRSAILAAAAAAKTMGKPCVLPEDVAAALAALVDLNDERRDRAAKMADAMRLFCTGLAGKFFNRPGRLWPEADVTHVKMGVLTREGYEDQLALAYTSLMSRVNDELERRQYESRLTLFVTDEGHIITKNPLLAPVVVKGTKMWRQYGGWYWNATQQLADFPDEARKMLGMMEWWLCLWPGKDEVEQITRFRELSDEQRALLLAARKDPGKYTEGVVLGNDYSALFRVVPPALNLALAQTEKHERVPRADLMREHGISELEAAYVIAERIRARRGA